MEKLLFIYNNPLDGSFGGSQRTVQNFEGLKTRFDVIPYELTNKNNKIKTFFQSLFGYISNATFFDFKKIKKELITKDIKYVFFDQATHGKIVKKISNLKTISFKEIFVHYHNNEEQYYHDLLKQQGILYYSIYLAAKKNQQLSLRYATTNVFITKEDSISVGDCVGKKIIIPITLKNHYNAEPTNKKPEKTYALFLGAATYANIEGAKYIISKIATNCKTIDFVIAGKGMKESLKNEKIPENVTIFSFIEDLKPLFENAFVFLVPLFSGSGMKVKIAEAMMYGKKVLGSQLAWWGYEIPNDSFICGDYSDYIEKLNSIKQSGSVFSKDSFEIFKKYYDQTLNETYYSLL